MGTKKQIRREILSIRDALSKEERKKKSDRIKKRLARERIPQHQGTTAPAAVAAETGGSCHHARNGV